MRKIKLLGLAILCGALAVGITKPAKAVSEAVTLSATPSPATNSISLQWNSSDTSQKYSYMLYSKADDETVFQSIPAKSDIKVLNVYPDNTGGDHSVTGTVNFTSALDHKTYTLPKSAAAKMWIEAANSKCDQGYGKGHIFVDTMSITDFNYGTWKALHNSDGTYKYDVLYFGAWDNNNSQDLSAKAEIATDAFIRTGRGVCFGHDTLVSNNAVANPNFFMLAHFINIKTINRYTPLGGTEISVMKKGLLTNYPWNIGDVGTTLTVPLSHSNSQIALGDIWMAYQPPFSIDGGVHSDSNGKGTNNFYLTTWSNCAMIQTGHSEGEASQAEQEILANTLFYLGQITTDTSWNDHKGQDLAAPEKPVISSVTHNADRSRYTVNYTASKDNGTLYQYYVEATGQSDGKKFTSATVSAKITSGIAGYKVIADHSPDTVVSGTADTTSTSCSFSRPDGPTFYAHVAAVDNAGNVSETATYFVDERISVSHPSSITYKIDPDSSTPFISSEIPITNNSTIPVKVFVQGLSNVSGGNLSLKDVSPEKYADWNRLTVAQTKSDAAFGVRVKEASTGPGTWSSISQGETVYTANMSKTLMGTLNAKGTGTIIVTADCGRAWDRQYAAFQNLSLAFES